MIANLMMYARPELVDLHRVFWELIRQELSVLGIESPTELSQENEEFSVWLDPDLVLSQTCGMPYRSKLHGHVQIVGTPDYDIPGCSPGYYRSPVIVHVDDSRKSFREYREAVFAYNQTISQSGYAAAYWHAEAHGFWFSKRVKTGGHRTSAIAVAEQRAEIATLDAVTWRLIQRYDDFAKDIRVLEWTVPTPGLPLITSNKHDPVQIFHAVSQAIKALDPQDRATLGMTDLVKIPVENYLSVKNPPLEECNR